MSVEVLTSVGVKDYLSNLEKAVVHGSQTKQNTTQYDKLLVNGKGWLVSIHNNSSSDINAYIEIDGVKFMPSENNSNPTFCIYTIRNTMFLFTRFETSLKVTSDIDGLHVFYLLE